MCEPFHCLKNWWTQEPMFFNHSLLALHHTFFLRYQRCIPCGSSDRGETILQRILGLCVADWQPPAAESYCSGCLPSLSPQQWQPFSAFPYSSHQLPQSSAVKFEQHIPELFRAKEDLAAICSTRVWIFLLWNTASNILCTKDGGFDVHCTHCH